MRRTTEYHTKQKEEIITYLKSMLGMKITVSDIVKHFAACGTAIGTATIYRHLDHMVANGTVKKYYIDGVSGAYFEYVGENMENQEKRFYLKCEECGKLVRFQCEELERIQNHLLSDHGFSINSAKTVFYGICNQCMLNQ